ncbi:MAG: hypothetical protein V3W19_01265, partial [Desulfatiglandales bacterium]
MRGNKSTLLALAAVFMISLWACESSLNSEGDQTVADTPEKVIRATNFVGAGRCGRCHDTMHEGWAKTAHTQKLRDGSLEGNYINDIDDSGRSDFFDTNGLELKDQTDFESFDTNAPVLGSDGSGPYIQINAGKYYIAYTLGGSAVKSRETADTNSDGLILNGE